MPPRSDFRILDVLPPYPHCLSTCWGSTREVLSGGETAGDQEERVAIGKGARDKEADAPSVAHDDRTNLEQFATQGARLGARPVGADQSDVAQPRHQYVGQTREQQTELIRPPQMAAGAIGKQAELALLD